MVSDGKVDTSGLEVIHDENCCVSELSSPTRVR